GGKRRVGSDAGDHASATTRWCAVPPRALGAGYGRSARLAWWPAPRWHVVDLARHSGGLGRPRLAFGQRGRGTANVPDLSVTVVWRLRDELLAAAEVAALVGVEVVRQPGGQRHDRHRGVDRQGPREYAAVAHVEA